MKQPIKRILLVSVAAILTASPVAVSAHSGHDHAVSDEPTSSTERPSRSTRANDQMLDRYDKQRHDRLDAMEDKSERLRERLDSAARHICEKHQNAINRVMSNMNNRRQSTLERISKISEAVQKFYKDKNLNTEGYTELIAEVEAAKNTAVSATTKQRGVSPLDCNGGHPRADLAEFAQRRTSAINAMKTYRDAVKNLVKAVKMAAQEDTQS